MCLKLNIWALAKAEIIRNVATQWGQDRQKQAYLNGCSIFGCVVSSYRLQRLNGASHKAHVLRTSLNASQLH